MTAVESARAAGMEYEVTIDVDAPVERVWAVMSDVERWPDWTPSIRSVRLLDGGPLRVSSRAEVRQPRLPPATWHVTSVDDEGAERRAFVWEAGAPGLRSVGSHAVVARPEGGSTVTLSIRTRGVLGRLMWPLLGGLTRRYVSIEAESLKAEAERTR